MWFGLAKMALQAGGKIYSNRQKTKMAMSDAQLLHAERMARGEETYQGKLLEARRDNDYKDEIVLCDFNAPDNNFGLGGLVRRSGCDGEDKHLLRAFFGTANMVHKFMDPCMCASIFGIKGTQIFRKNGGANKK